jgi:hypothetical protein
MPDSIDIENLIVAMALELRRNNRNWMTFRELARRIRGDVEDAHLLAAIAATRKELFVIHADTRLKLRFEAIQEIATQSTGPNTVSPPPLHTEAALAVTEYARQLRLLQFHVISTDKGRRVLDRYGTIGNLRSLSSSQRPSSPGTDRDFAFSGSGKVGPAR